MFPRDMVILGNISVDTLHKGDTEDNNNNNNNNNHHHPSRVRHLCTCFTKHVTLIKLTHYNPSFLNSVSILSSNLHLHLFILKFLNPPFCKNFSFCLHVHMSYISYHLWFNYFRASVRQRPTSVETNSSLILLETLTLPLKKTVISLYWSYSFLFLIK